MMMFRRALLILLSLLAISTSSVGQEFKGEQLVTPSLIASNTAIDGNHPFTVGILLKMAPGWHTYWQFSGDSGAPPEIEWELPAGFTAGPIQWPIPTPHRDDGDFLTYIYEGEVMLLVDITPPAALPPGEHALKAKLKWLVCEKTCIPGDANVALSLPSGPPAAANAELFAHWRSKLPKNPPHPFESDWRVEGAEALLRLRGLPKETSIALAPLPPAPNVRPGHPRVDEPAEDGVRTIHLPFEGDATAAAFGGVLITQTGSGPREGWLIAPSAQAIRGATLPATGASSPRAAPRLIGVLGFAFLGGMILNLMPCVLPVIALKIFGFVQQAGEAPERIFRLGLAFAAGVFAFFLGLAALVAGLHLAGRGLNWGFQFQNAYILTGLIALVFVFALAMFGLFEVTLAGDTATRLDSLSRREGYFGAFTHGLFTTLLGTSCTAPFLGPVLGFAFVQPPAIVFLIFAVIAAGMSLPYVLLTWRPAWMRFLPKPGAWMERLKQFMGFVLLAVVVWLLGVLGESRGAAAVTTVCAFLLALGLACWLYGAFRQRVVASVFALLLLGASWFIFIDGKVNAAQPTGSTIAASKDGVPWEVFSPAKIDQARTAGRPVFIDFTADWCLNCKYNEKFVIETAPVRAAFKKHNVLALKADWTNGDPLITTWLKKYDRIGVPVYVIYPKQNADPIVLPEILTQTSLLEAIARAGS